MKCSIAIEISATGDYSVFAFATAFKEHILNNNKNNMTNLRSMVRTPETASTYVLTKLKKNPYDFYNFYLNSNVTLFKKTYYTYIYASFDYLKIVSL